MLDRARERCGAEVEYILTSLSEFKVKNQFELALMFNSWFPENHSHAVKIAQAGLNSLTETGHLILVTFSQECLGLFINLLHLQNALKDQELESLEMVAKWHVEKQNNPLGYTVHRNSTVNKHWIREEAETLFLACCNAEIIEYFKVNQESERSLPFDFKPFFHGWVLRRKAG